MATLNLTLDGADRVVGFDKLIMAGYTGRNQDEVRAHIEELKAHGIPAPAKVPTLFACAPELLTTAETITVLGDSTSGEAEFVLFVKGGEILVGVGSDHTDRQLEETDIPRAKQLCAKVVSREVWRLSDLVGHWDELVLRAWVGEKGAETLYQEGPLARMMTPQAILECVQENITEPLEAAVVYSGTFAVIGGHFQALPVFTVELEDPRRRRKLHCAYRVRQMDYLK